MNYHEGEPKFAVNPVYELLLTLLCALCCGGGLGQSNQ